MKRIGFQKGRWLSLMIVMVMVISLLSGCKVNTADNGTETAAQGSGTETKTTAGDSDSTSAIDTSKEVTLTMYLLGDKAADFDLVYDEINKKLKERVNAALDVKFLSWAEHDTKYSLLFSSGEDFDLIFTASGWAHYETTAAKKGFYELSEDFVKTYAPGVYEVVPEEAWNQTKINGKTYMVPNYQKEYGIDMIGVRGDLMEKYGMTDITSKEDLEAYFDKVAEDESDISPLATQGGGLLYPYLFQHRGWKEVKGIPGVLFLYEYANPDNLDIVYTIDSPEFLEYAKKMKEMYSKGYWSSDSLSTTDTRNDNWTQGKSAAMIWNIGNVVNYAREINKTHPEWKATFVDIAPDMIKPVNAYTNNGIAINAASKNPERAMMVINELMTNKEIYDLASLGIEGVHYTAVDEDKYSPIDGAADRYPANGSCNWGWTNMDIDRQLYVENPDEVYLKQQETLAKWDSNTTPSHIYSTFSFNEENVKSEAAVVNTLITQYFDPISAGMIDDVDAAVAELSQKLKEAGIDRIYEELKKQASAFAAEMQ